MPPGIGLVSATVICIRANVAQILLSIKINEAFSVRTTQVPQVF